MVLQHSSWIEGAVSYKGSAGADVREGEVNLAGTHTQVFSASYKSNTASYHAVTFPSSALIYELQKGHMETKPL